MKTRGFGSTDVGRKRKNNEDALLVDDRLGLYAVADGLGGYRGSSGAVAEVPVLRIRLRHH